MTATLKRALLLAVAVLALAAPSAQAAGAPTVLATWVDTITPAGANLRAEINPNEASTLFQFEFVTEADYLATGFAGARKAPVNAAAIGSGSTPIAVVQHIGGLEPGSTYRYRVTATNVEGPGTGAVGKLTTDEPGAPFALPDGRGWEMVSPAEKNGGGIEGPGAILGGGVLQAASTGGAITYSSSFSFANPQGAAGASQYISRRTEAGWATQNITLPSFSGTFPDKAGQGVPYQLFSGDLDSALVSNGRRCREEGAVGCPVENPPLAGSGAPAGYRNYYLRDNGSGGYRAVLSGADLAGSALGPDEFEVALAGATPDLSSVVLSTCAALTAGATEVPAGGGECAAAATNLYVKSGTGALRLINLKPGDLTGTNGAALATQGAAISSDGNRVYWTVGGNVYLREFGGTPVSKQADADLGGGGTFQTASLSGDVAYLTKAGHLWRYSAGTDQATDITPGGGVEGVLGASDDGAVVYYLTAAGVFSYRAGNTVAVAAGAAATNYPPTTGTARVTPDGNRLLFVSASQLTEYDNNGIAEVYLYVAGPGGAAGTVNCLSCNPSGERPVGPASLPGAYPNGNGPNSPDVYKARALVAGGNRVFFDTVDPLVPQDFNGKADVYEWEAYGIGSCAKPQGCVAMISSGQSEAPAEFVDASAGGDDVYFLTDTSLVSTDPGAYDIYDARVGGGFVPPAAGIPCFGDACQPLPPEPEDPTPGTLRANSRINPPAALANGGGKSCKKGKVKKRGRCVAKKQHKKKAKKSKKGARR